MPLPLSDMPLEVLWQIADWIPFETLLSLAGTSKSVRHALAPLIFSTIYLRSDEKLAHELASLAASHIRQHVQTLNFLPTSRYDESSIPSLQEDEGCGIRPSMLYEAVEYVLRNLSSLFQRLVTISIDLYCDSMEISEFGAYFYYLDRTDRSILRASDLLWQWLIGDVFEALLGRSHHGNPNEDTGQIYYFPPSLQIKEFPAYEAPIYSDPSFRRALGSLEKFDIHINSEHTDWQDLPVSETAEYGRVMQKLDQIFFDHLTSVQSLHVSVDILGILGQCEIPRSSPHQYFVDFPLKPHQMPRLSNLELNGIIIGSYLNDFLKAHSKSLVSVTLKDCYAGSPAGKLSRSDWESSSSHNAAKTEWARLFNALCEHQAQNLKYFKVLPTVLCPVNHDGSSAVDNYEVYLKKFPCFEPPFQSRYSQTAHRRSESILLHETKQIRRMFPYGRASFNPPIRLYDDLTVAALLFGKDHFAWTQLLERVAQNQRTS